MSHRPHGKHVIIDSTHPQALGICDYSGFVFLRKDMVRQMEWRGDALVWTGFYVGKPYADVPNQQNRPPILEPDPVPVRDPRLPQGSTETHSNNTLPLISQIATDHSQIGNIYDGAPAPSEAVRLSLLQQDRAPSLAANGAPAEPNPLTQAQILSQLQSTSWITP